MASGSVIGIQHRARAVEEVLDALECQPASYLLLNLRSHLAALGITRLADVLRWEAFAHLAILEATDLQGAEQPSYNAEFNTALKLQATGSMQHNDHTLEASHDGGISSHDSPSCWGLSAMHTSPPIHDGLHSERAHVPSTAGGLYKRAQPRHSDSNNSRVPLAKRMRQMSSMLQEEVHINAPKELGAAQMHQACPCHSIENAPTAVISGQMTVAHATHAHSTERKSSAAATAIAAAKQVPAAQQGASAPTSFKSSFAPAVMPPGNSNTAVSTCHQQIQPFSASVQQPGSSGCAPQQIETSSGVSPALLQRWLAYRPPPAHSSGLKLSQCVPGCKFLVDLFSKSAQKSGARHFFLTHFHYDHYMGLSKSFSAGTIYCTPETARLVQLKLKVPAKRLHTANIGEPFQVSNCTITFLPANHCPGAVMVVFQRPRQAPVLHCGDCRYHAEMFQSRPELQALRYKAILHLDTTYCAPKHHFPLQADVVTEVVRLVRAAFEKQQSAGKRPPLLVFGSYTIGKERIFMEVALAMNKKVYVEQDKWNVLRCLDMRVRERELITRNMNEAGIHVVPMRQIRSDRLKERLDKHGGFGTVLAFKPTGWTFDGKTADKSQPAPFKAPTSTPQHTGTSTAPMTAPVSAPATSNVNDTRDHGTASGTAPATEQAPGVHDHTASAAAANMHSNAAIYCEADCHAHTVCDEQHGLEVAPCGDAGEDDTFESEEELDEDDAALFELDVSKDKENIGALRPTVRNIVDISLDARPPQRRFDVLSSKGSHWGDEDAAQGALNDVSHTPDEHAANPTKGKAACAQDDASNDVIDLCNSQCSPQPQLRELQRKRTNDHDTTRSGAPTGPAAVLRCSRPPLKESGCNATAPAAERNALQYLMQPARKSAKETAARSESQTAKSGPADAFSVMQSAQQKASKRNSRYSAKGNRASAAAAGVDKDACASWVSVRSSGAVQILEVPYSEHSSFDELREFVSWLQPIAVVPTVGGSASATPSMLQMLGQTVGSA